MILLSRRRFLEETLLAAAAGAAIAPAGAMAAGDKQSASPNERLSVAVIGIHGRGQDHADAYSARRDCQLTYVCDVDQNVGQKYAAQRSAKGRPIQYVQDLRRVFEDKSVDIVSIATPNHWHALAAIWAMQAGKDVYVEKPVSHVLSEGRRLIEVSRKYHRICQAGTQHRSNGSNRAAARYVKSGKLGRIELVRCVMHRPRKSIGPAGKYGVPPGLDYNLWAGPAPIDPVTRKSFHYDWHWFWNYGNGEIGNNNIHCVDAARLIAGLTGLGRGALSYGGRVAFDDAGETANIQVAMHDFGDVTLVQEVRNLTTPPPRAGGAILVRGSEGYLVGQLTGGNSVYDPQGKLTEKLDGPGDDHFDNFIKAVRSRKREEQNAEIAESHISAALIHLANISYRLGRPASPAEIGRQLRERVIAHENAQETFDLTRGAHLASNHVDIERKPLSIGPWLSLAAETESFVGNATADLLLTCKYRKPFNVPSAKEI